MEFPKPKKSYGQAYRNEWEKYLEFSTWLSRAKHYANGMLAFCKACDEKMAAKLYNLKSHAKFLKHQRKFKGYSGQPSVRILGRFYYD